MITGLVVLKMVLMPSRQRLASLENSGPRWSMIGVSMARRIRSGSGVGPGMCRKWRPAVRDEFFDMISLRFFVTEGGRKGRLKGGFGLSDPAACRHEWRMRRSDSSLIGASVPIPKFASVRGDL